jgi:hypothetical protein
MAHLCCGALRRKHRHSHWRHVVAAPVVLSMLQRRHQLSARRLLRSITAGPRPLADALLLDALLLLPPPHLPHLRFNYLEHFGPSNEMHEMLEIPSALLKDAFGESSDLLFFLFLPTKNLPKKGTACSSGVLSPDLERDRQTTDDGQPIIDL